MAISGLKLKIEAGNNWNAFECAMVSSLRVNPNDTPNCLIAQNWEYLVSRYQQAHTFDSRPVYK